MIIVDLSTPCEGSRFGRDIKLHDNSGKTESKEERNKTENRLSISLG